MGYNSNTNTPPCSYYFTMACIKRAVDIVDKGHEHLYFTRDKIQVVPMDSHMDLITKHNSLSQWQHYPITWSSPYPPLFGRCQIQSTVQCKAIDALSSLQDLELFFVSPLCCPSTPYTVEERLITRHLQSVGLTLAAISLPVVPCCTLNTCPDTPCPIFSFFTMSADEVREIALVFATISSNSSSCFMLEREGCLFMNTWELMCAYIKYC